MGQALTGPVTTKASGNGANKAGSPGVPLAWGYSAMQGWREGMEDAHFAIGSLSGLQSHGWEQTALFGVLDGHGGEHVARFCERYLPEEIMKGPAEDPEAALVNAFHRMDEMLFDPANLEDFRNFSNSSVVKAWFAHPDTIGCTAVVCCVRPDKIVVANVGDSRAVLCRDGMAMDLSEDHKPNLPRERARIHKAGASIEMQQIGPITQYRINGNLNLSRSLGDLAYKQNPELTPSEQIISPTPDVRFFDRHPGDTFMVIACDGVWDVMSSQEVVDFVKQRLGERRMTAPQLQPDNMKLSSILEDLLDRCLSPDLQETWGLGGDNMTAILVLFPRDETALARQ
eukprot:CAMPEP_0178435978 /NCGR_PEP_ID=MMETSP0689_2-20121128/34204_1 /TAXON_ID=160604 /ORGANISM="Amphidinium massartii, Strain CS-259" /LENGTH=341 /DNA_ID=CAMNT_0020058063 /DNA_START=63 /DNA_END=1085 /DNA_ORIENTATION=-